MLVFVSFSLFKSGYLSGTIFKKFRTGITIQTHDSTSCRHPSLDKLMFIDVLKKLVVHVLIILVSFVNRNFFFTPSFKFYLRPMLSAPNVE